MLFENSKWISANPSIKSAPYFRKDFDSSKKLHSAKLGISGLGYYEVFLNGHRVGDHVLDPSQTDYEKRVFYLEYNVKDLIEDGINSIVVLLGNGWYHQNRVWGKRIKEKNINGEVIEGCEGYSYGEPKFLLDLELCYENGDQKTLNSSEESMPLLNRLFLCDLIL
jgi:alpha-L-rhamnosidase